RHFHPLTPPSRSKHQYLTTLIGSLTSSMIRSVTYRDSSCTPGSLGSFLGWRQWALHSTHHISTHLQVGILNTARTTTLSGITIRTTSQYITRARMMSCHSTGQRTQLRALFSLGTWILR